MSHTMIRTLLAGVMAVLALQGAAPAQTGGRSLPVDGRHLTVLVKTSIIAVNQANRTNNYSVLHALSAPGFQDRNSPEDLAKIFGKLRGAGLDLAPIVVYEPRFTRSPEITPKGFLRLAGYFPTAPLSIHFDMLFQPVGGNWRLYGISVRPAQAGAAQEQARR